jgi:hypothetical protein
MRTKIIIVEEMLAVVTECGAHIVSRTSEQLLERHLQESDGITGKG